MIADVKEESVVATTAEGGTQKRAGDVNSDGVRKQAKLTGFFKKSKPADDEPTQPIGDEPKPLFHLESFTMVSLLQLANAHSSWKSKLCDEFKKPYMRDLQAFLRTELAGQHPIYPPVHQIFSWAALCPFDDIRVVILGQDPYHGPGQAHGLAFSVAKGVPPPPSLLNIYKELEADIPGFKRPSHGFLEGWAKQGVLLLNTSLTVRSGQPASHAGRGWEALTDAIVRAISRDLEHVVFLLWGAHAHKRAPLIDGQRHLVLQSAHPSPLSASRGFLGCRHFSTTNKYLQENGKSPINWSL